MPRTRLRLLKQLIGLPEVDSPAPMKMSGGGGQSSMSDASDEDMVGSPSNSFSNQ